VPNREDALAVRARIIDRLSGVRKPARAYFHAYDHAREYTVGELERLVEPHFAIRSHHAVGWDRGRKSRVASALVAAPPLRRLGQAIVVVATPRTTP
jgi:hypothetical protein